MSKPFRVAIIGVGMITNSAHIPAYRNLPEDFEIVGVCDINEEAAKATAGRHGIPHYFTDAEEMLKELHPDVVSVCTPNFLHKQYSMLALRYGAHVLCEKPVATTYRDAAELYDLAGQQGKYLIACQSMRFTADRMAAKQFIEQGGLGQLYYGEFSRIRRRGIPTWGKFHIKEVSCGGALIDIGVHMIDAVLWLTGNPKVQSVTATTSKYHSYELGDLKESGALTGTVDNRRPFDPEEMNVEDFASGSIRFENGARVNFKVAWAANLPNETSIRLVGNQAGIALPESVIYRGADSDTPLAPIENPYAAEAFAGHFYLFRHVRDVLRGNAALLVRPEETINVAAVLDCFYKSAGLGREVKLEELV